MFKRDTYNTHIVQLYSNQILPLLFVLANSFNKEISVKGGKLADIAHRPQKESLSIPSILYGQHLPKRLANADAPYLLVVLDAHAESIDKDGDHNPSVEVFTLHDPFQLFPEVSPGLQQPVLVAHRPPSP